MRVLAELECPTCARLYYGDLPTGHGLSYPSLLDAETGEAHDDHGQVWFAEWLAESYRHRSRDSVGFSIERLQPVHRPLVLNCLDAVYGHGLLKLLNAQMYLDRCSEMDLIVIVPKWLQWLVPDGVAQIWEVDLPLRGGSAWSDHLAQRFAQELDHYETIYLAPAINHPHPDDISIERFTRIRPFDVENWTSLQPYKVTFIWRGDRSWGEATDTSILAQLAQRVLNGDRTQRQAALVTELASRLRAKHPEIDFAVTGIGQLGGLPTWIRDLRAEVITRETEIAWCHRYAQSHVVIGVHGSNLLLPSAHAGAVIDLMPGDRWGNVVQDVLPATSDARDALARYQFLPLETSPTTVAGVAASMLEQLPLIRTNFERPRVDSRLFSDNPQETERAERQAVGEVV